METETIRERLQEYIRFADDKKVHAIYTIVEEEIQNDLNLWEDEEFLNEMKNREDEYLKGITIPVSLEEFKSAINNR